MTAQTRKPDRKHDSATFVGKRVRKFAQRSGCDVMPHSHVLTLASQISPLPLRLKNAGMTTERDAQGQNGPRTSCSSSHECMARTHHLCELHTSQCREELCAISRSVSFAEEIIDTIHAHVLLNF
jgi:hypothetical protein